MHAPDGLSLLPQGRGARSARKARVNDHPLGAADPDPQHAGISIAGLTMLSAVVSVGLTCAGVLAFAWAFNRLDAERQSANRAAEFAMEVEALMPAGLQLGQATRNVLLNPADKKAAANYEKASEQLDQHLGRVGEMLQVQPVDGLAANHTRLVAQMRGDRALQREVMALAVAGHEGDARALLADKETPEWREAKVSINALRDGAKAEVARRRDAFAQRSSGLKTFMVALALLLVLTPLLVGWASRRAVAGIERNLASVRGVAHRLTDTAQVVSSSSHELAASTSRQAASNEETRATLATMSQQVRANTGSASEVREQAHLASAAPKKCGS